MLEECTCRDNATGIDHDFCYQLDKTAYNNRPPGNPNASADGSEAMVRGQRFDCRWLRTAQRLGLLDKDGFVDLERGDALPPAVFVSGVSSNHYKEEEKLIYLVQKYFPHQKLVLYDLGLSDDTVRTVKGYCNVEYRKFPFESFPDYVSKLHQYRWKPLIIAEALQEFKVIWWLDSSVVWKKSDLSHVYDLVQCQQNLGDKMKTIHRLERKSDRSAKEIESGWDKNQWRAAMLRCDKFPYLLHGYTGHGIFPVTNKGVYKYLPTDVERLKNPQAMMFEAGFAFAVRTKEVMQRVVKCCETPGSNSFRPRGAKRRVVGHNKGAIPRVREAHEWYSLCALEEQCMAPPGSSLGCSFKGSRFTDHAGCHRFDQSVVNLLLANANAYDRYYWTSGIVDFFNIVRGGGPPTPPRQCVTSPKPSSHNAHARAKQP